VKQQGPRWDDFLLRPLCLSAEGAAGAFFTQQFLDKGEVLANNASVKSSRRPQRPGPINAKEPSMLVKVVEFFRRRYRYISPPP
jgi:hypothetical protein